MAGTSNSGYQPSRWRVPLATAGLLLVCLLSPGRAAGFRPSPFRDYGDAIWSPVTGTAEPSVNGPWSLRPPSEAPAPTPRSTARPRPTYAPTVADAQAYARDRLGAAGFGCLDQIVRHEGSWNNTLVYNHGGSGAYGIPQALPGEKMAWAGADWRTNPVTQIRWMIHYVAGRYGSVCGGWAFWQAHRWY